MNATQFGIRNERRGTRCRGMLDFLGLTGFNLRLKYPLSRESRKDDAVSIKTLSTTILCVACCAWWAVAADNPTPHPNIVLIVADDLGWSDVACYGGDLHETPNLDRLARQGIRFTDAYAASICSPSRAALLTGKHYARLHMTIWREGSFREATDQKLLQPKCVADLPYQEETLAEVLKKAGYLTALVGKWHLGDADFYPETQGFDINIGGTHWGAPQTFFFPYKGQGRFQGEFRYVPGLQDGKPGDYLTDQLTDEAIKVINRAGEKPFFLYLAHHAPHTPIEAPADLVKHYEQKLKPELNHTNPKYAAMIHNLDQSVGRILDQLEKQKLADKTIVVFISDNGGQIGNFAGTKITSNAPLRSGKGSLYEGGVRVPLLICGPGIKSGEVCREPVYIADLFPTIADLTEMTAQTLTKDSSDGKSLAGLLRSPDGHLERDELFFHYPHYYPTTTPVGAIRKGDWKLLEYFEDQRVELYNLKDDLSESKDLSKAMPEQADRLRARLAEWRQSVDAQMPKVNPNYQPKPAAN